MIRDLRLGVAQVGYEARSFFRNPAAAGFTFLFPAMFLVIFGAIYGKEQYRLPDGGSVLGIQFQMAQILVFSVVGTTYVSLVTMLALRRDTGELKRKRGTPVSPAVILGGVVGNGVMLSLMMSVGVVVLSIVLFGASVESERIPAMVLTVTIGALAFCAIGAAVAAFVPNGDAASPIANLTIFPLYFISGIFIPDIPDAMADAAGVLPLRPFLLALSTLFDPTSAGHVAWGDLAIVTAWGAVAALLAVRFFRWAPRR